MQQPADLTEDSVAPGINRLTGGRREARERRGPPAVPRDKLSKRFPPWFPPALRLFPALLGEERPNQRDVPLPWQAP